MVAGKDVLEVGSFDGNGTLRRDVVGLEPARYVGVDLKQGAGVDEICAVEGIEDRFGSDAFDLVISTEMLEHVADWRVAVAKMKAVLRPDGLILITTRSIGYPYHAEPRDYWRYEPEDIEAIFGDFRILALERDPSMPGVFLLGRRLEVPPVDLGPIALHSMVLGRRALAFGRLDLARSMLLSPRRAASIFPPSLKRPLRAMWHAMGRS
jgi:SAM-dependent methyltransferase